MIAPPAAAEPAIVDLGVLPGGYFSTAHDINNAGQIVGQSDASNASYAHPILWQDGTMLDLGTRGSGFGVAYGINDRGQVVGWTGIPFTPYTGAFLWEDGVMKDLETLPGGSWSTAYAINDLGQVVGAGDNETGDVHAVLWPDPAAVHDVAVTSSFADAVVAFAGTPVTVHATVRNEGNRAETFDVLAFAGSDVVGAVTVTDLAPRASGRVSITWDTSGHAAGLYAIRVEVVPVDQETDVADNAHSDDSVVLLPSPMGILGFP
jgi:probable HAF family extracellular repeat protein